MNAQEKQIAGKYELRGGAARFCGLDGSDGNEISVALNLRNGGEQRNLTLQELLHHS